MPGLFNKFSVDLLAVIEVISQRRINITQGNSRKLIDNLIGRETALFMPDYDIQHSHTMSGDVRATTQNVWFTDDMLNSHMIHINLIHLLVYHADQPPSTTKFAPVI